MKESEKVKESKKAPVRATRAKSAPAKPRSGVSASRRKPKVVDGISPQQRYEMVAQAAYYRAAERGFSPGNELEDWIAAEAEIEQLLAAR